MHLKSNVMTSQAMRENSVRIKLNVLKSTVEGKRVVMVDDSIVRGTTSKRIVSLLRHFGATEVHVRSSAPPFMFPCYFGTDVPSKDQLVACNYTMDGIKELIGADSIGFLSVNSLEKIIPNANCQFCDTTMNSSIFLNFLRIQPFLQNRLTYK